MTTYTHTTKIYEEKETDLILIVWECNEYPVKNHGWASRILTADERIKYACPSYYVKPANYIYDMLCLYGAVENNS
jgi:hypothetical protein